jgi:hypothetical protein
MPAATIVCAVGDVIINRSADGQRADRAARHSKPQVASGYQQRIADNLDQPLLVVLTEDLWSDPDAVT